MGRKAVVFGFNSLNFSRNFEAGVYSGPFKNRMSGSDLSKRLRTNDDASL